MACYRVNFAVTYVNYTTSESDIFLSVLFTDAVSTKIIECYDR